MKLRYAMVRIEYRIDAGASLPRWKALRGRVVSANGQMGTDLFSPTCMNVDQACCYALAALRNVETVEFTFDSRIGLENRTYKNGRLVDAKMVP